MIEFCDDCGIGLDPAERCVVESLRRDTASANTGESATLCPKCFLKLED